MQTLHVMPDTHGNWCIVDDDSGVPMSRYETATGAERAARSLASAANAEHIYVHDLYHRVHSVDPAGTQPGSQESLKV